MDRTQLLAGEWAASQWPRCDCSPGKALQADREQQRQSSLHSLPGGIHRGRGQPAPLEARGSPTWPEQSQPGRERVRNIPGSVTRAELESQHQEDGKTLIYISQNPRDMDGCQSGEWIAAGNRDPRSVELIPLSPSPTFWAQGWVQQPGAALPVSSDGLWNFGSVVAHAK
ncbi:hypothetical protein CB1_001533094 [Camelus ferus]|nr:hypothetical protein CB1_001533094 [Camelus ferus]